MAIRHEADRRAWRCGADYGRWCMGRGGSIVDEFTSQFGRSPADPLGAEPDSLGVCANRPLGEAWVFVGSYEPEGTVFAHGQILSIVTYSSLYSLVGTSYGGNGQTTFGVPDLRGIEPQGLNYVICVFGVFPPQN